MFTSGVSSEAVRLSNVWLFHSWGSSSESFQQEERAHLDSGQKLRLWPWSEYKQSFTKLPLAESNQWFSGFLQGDKSWSDCHEDCNPFGQFSTPSSLDQFTLSF
ncbi:hypothetical protein ATANTOWER_009364 [Ataeniobius toweri]|uniref:Uncharacterized protein n=1 Tax=Ataeniobius toweri TaxID=208326 RepID=A0ABU7B658_9TELE|nr:hypothetical protein [Ataeniobius toweri]